MDDAIVDYTIGLEALLLAGVNAELSYRFSLRGATVLGWDGGPVNPHFDALKQLYRTRSRIVHGDSIDFDTLQKARAIGEHVLRRVWWWFFESAGDRVDYGITQIEERIIR